MDGRISIHRKILDRERYTDINTKCTFIHCLFEANIEDKIWRGIEIKRGSFITSIENLSNKINISPMQIRTSLDKLISTGEIIKQTTNKYTLIIVVKYNDYQSKEGRDNKQITNKQQTNNKQITTTKEYKNIRTKEDINNNTFEIFRKQFPHARKGKKQEALSYFKKQNVDEVMNETKLLIRRIDIGEQDPKFIPACERRIRDFTILSGGVKETVMKKIAYYIFGTQGEERIKNVDRFIDDFGKDTLEIYRKQRSKEKNGVKFILK